MIVVDTNVLSELMRPAPNGQVLGWLRSNAAKIAIPSVVIGELGYGIARLPRGKRKESLTLALDALVERFSGSLIAYDVLAARACGDILATAESAGRPMTLADAQISACARIARAALATRNIADFATTGLKIIDPWSS